MQFLTSFTTYLTAHQYVAYPILFFGGFIEILVPFGFFIPGEIFFFSGGILSATGVLNVWLVGISLIVGGILGDIGSFFIGRRYAAPVERFMRRTGFTEGVYLRGKDFVARHKGRSVFLARFFGPASWVVPFLAGASGMRIRRFLVLEPLPAALAIGWNIGIGYALGLGYAFATRFVHQSAIFAAVAALVILVGVPFFFQSRGPCRGPIPSEKRD